MTYIIGAPCVDGWIVASDGMATLEGLGLKRSDQSKFCFEREGVLLSLSGTHPGLYLHDLLDRCAPDPHELARVVAGEMESTWQLLADGERSGASLVAWLADRRAVHFAIKPEGANAKIKATPIHFSDADTFEFELQGMVLAVQEKMTIPSRWHSLHTTRIRDLSKETAIEFAADVQRCAARAVPDLVGGLITIRHVTMSGEIVAIAPPCPCNSGREFQSCHGGGT